MTVESNYVIAIAMLSDWLKGLAPVFQPMRRKPKPIAPCTRDFSRALSMLRVVTGTLHTVVAPAVHAAVKILLGTFRSEYEYEYEYDYEYEFSVLSTRIRFRGRHFSKCACSERKTRTRTRTPI